MKKFFLAFFIACMLGSCVTQKSDESQIFEIVVLPHHWLTGKNIDNYYENLQKEFWLFDRIIIVSPDHFGKSQKYIETIPDIIAKICFYQKCVKSKSFSEYNNAKISNSKIFTKNGDTKEHWLGEHILRISKFFPDANVTPILVRPQIQIQWADQEVAKILSKLPEKRILVVASVDFSHHVRERVALIHDQIAVNALKFRDPKNFSNLEVDCRNCLAIAKYLAQEKWKKWFDQILRTSVDTITGVDSDIENTSHIFGQFTQISAAWRDQKIFVYFPDFSHNANFRNIEKNFFNHYDSLKNPINYYHRIFSAVDGIFLITENGEVKNSENFSRLQKFGINTILSTEEFPKQFPEYEDHLGIKNETTIPYIICNNHITKNCNKYFLEVR